MLARTESVAAPRPERQEAVIEVRAPRKRLASKQAELHAPLADPAIAQAVKNALATFGSEQVEATEQTLATAVRLAAIQSARDYFYREMGGLRDSIERASATLPGGDEPLPRVGIAAASVQACWLNSTIRADTHASVLADAADDEAVERIDVPRRIKREGADVTIDNAASFGAQASLDGRGVLVAVIDSEVQLDHPSLAGRIIHRRNYTREPFGTPDFHGTAVAGLIASSGSGFTGMAPGSQIYNYKVLATQRALDGTDFEGTLALQHALEDGVQVANCSWGNGPAGDGTGREARACDEAWDLGMVVVKSAGNEGPGSGTLTTPADAEGVLVVGATSGDGRTVPGYSSHGPTADGRHRPHVVAPGGDAGAEIEGILLGGGTGLLGEIGTSFAAPHVTGMIALLLQREPHLQPDQVRDRIVSTCQLLPNLDADAQGAGLVNPTAL
jgi:serine protease AprX